MLLASAAELDIFRCIDLPALSLADSEYVLLDAFQMLKSVYLQPFALLLLHRATLESLIKFGKHGFSQRTLQFLWCLLPYDLLWIRHILVTGAALYAFRQHRNSLGSAFRRPCYFQLTFLQL